MWEEFHGRHLYLDANVVIAAAEGVSRPAAALKVMLAEVEAGRLLASTSEWTLAEVLVKPLARGERVRANAYVRQLSKTGTIAMVAVTQVILCEAARISAATGMPLPDCLHVASAGAAGCDVFVSNDRGIELPSQMERIVPDLFAL